MTISAPPVDASKQFSLRQKTTRGVFWVAGQAVATRAVTLLQQLALAWLLTNKSDFMLIGLAYTVTSIVTVMANPGVDSVLVQRLRHFHHWATPAFWLSVTMGLVGCALMLAISPLAAHAYQQSELIGMIAVLAIALPIQALQVVPKAQLQMQMRFRAITLIGVLNSVLTAILTVALAYFGWRAYSFVVPVPLVAAAVTATLWWLARTPITCHVGFHRWKYIFGNSATVGATNLLNTFINQADYIALGIAGIAGASIGAYVFAFNIAIQPLRLLSGNVPLVLFPGLSHMALDPDKQANAALRATRLLVMVTTPVCVLQMLLAKPVFQLIFPPHWTDAVLPCQILTFGLMINAVCWPAISLLLAQGRFREQFWVTFAIAIAFVGILAATIFFHPTIVAVAIAVAAFHCLYSPLLHWLATHEQASMSSFFGATTAPLVSGLIAAIPGGLLQWYLPANIVGDSTAIVLGGLIFSVVYLFLVALLAPQSFRDLLHQVAPLWNRICRREAEPRNNIASHDNSVA